MWELLIKLNKNNIKKYNGTNEKIFQIAIDKGYIPTEEDLKNNSNFCKSEAIMKKAVEINYNFIKYINLDYSFKIDSLLETAINLGYRPNMEDLMKNIKLSKNINYINIIIDNGDYNAIKYARFFNDELMEKAIDLGYVPTEEDLKNNKYLTESKKIMEYAIEQDYNLIKYIGFNNNDLIKKAIELGYNATLEDIKNNNHLCSLSDIFAKLINEDPSIIKYYINSFGVNINYELYNKAIDLGYVPTIEDIEDNPYLGCSDEIIKILLKQDVNVITKYNGYNEEIFKLALEKGFKLDISDIKKYKTTKYSYLLRSSVILKELLKKDISFIELYTGSDKEVYDYAMNLGYEVKIETLEKDDKLSNNKEFMIAIIKKHPEYIRYYNKNNDYYIDNEPYIIAIQNGFMYTEEEIKNSDFINKNKAIMTEICKINPEYIKYYNGSTYDKKTIEIEILKSGYLPSEEELLNNKDIYSNKDKMLAIVSIKPEYIKYYKSYMSLDKPEEVYTEAIKHGYLFSIDEIINNPVINNSKDIMLEICKIKPEYVKYYQGNSPSFYIDFINMGNILEEEFVKACKIVNKDNQIMEVVLKNNPEYIKYYQGKFKLNLKINALNYIPTLEEMIQQNLFNLEDNKLRELIEKNPELIFINNNNNNYNLYDIALENIDKINFAKIHSYTDENYIIKKNYIIMDTLVNKKYEEIKNIKNYEIKTILYKYIINKDIIPNISELKQSYIFSSWNIDYGIIEKIIKNSAIKDSLEVLYSLDENTMEHFEDFLIKEKKLDISIELLKLLKYYSNDREMFINNIKLYDYFLEANNINKNKFIQYAFSIQYNWLSDMINVIENNKLEEFLKIKEYFYKNYYFKDDDINDIENINAFIDILKNYNKYQELCVDLTNNIVNIKDKEKELNFLFNSNQTFDNHKIKNIKDLENLDNILKENYKEEIINISEKEIEDIKNIICKTLFNKTLNEIKSILNIYGNTENLRQMIFNNKKNNDLNESIYDIMIYTSMMESIILCNNKSDLINISNKILNNFKLTSNCSMLFNNYEEKMKKIFELDIKINLTNYNNISNNESLIDEEMTKKTGVKVVDYSKSDYCILAHKKSFRESLEDIIYGKSTGKSNFICLSAISYRNQVYYGNSSDVIIFGYDNIPKDTFIQSSISNMGSNASIKDNSSEIEEIYRKQRGVIETSHSLNGNNELLFYREGLKPKYIILVGGREPTSDEIEIAQKYDLYFLKTQELNVRIENPNKLEYKEEKEIGTKEEIIDELKKLKDILITNKSPKKVAIFSDSHALFEPTLAILEDARKSGIDEIYSLGDNIGTGPNPKEVQDLLEEYNVKSIKGNHEIYVEDIEQMQEHLEKAGAYEEAKDNSEFTKKQLTPEQLDKISNYPEELTIEIGGEKILLTHHTKDYNTDIEKAIPSDIDKVFQGHVHFENSNGKIETLRGAGLGSSEKIEEAYYIVLVEKEHGGYEIERHKVKFDPISLYHDINLSDLKQKDKDKIERWVGRSK